MASVNGLPISISGPLEDSLYLNAVIAEESMSQIPKIQIELATKDTNIKLEDFLGENYQVAVGEGDSFREFSGYCTQIEYLGTQTNWALYGLTLQPFLWFLTKTKNSRVFQGMKVEEIFDQILKDYWFDRDLDVKLGDPTRVRDYCVQYRETDFDFISRLLEEEGVSYHFEFKEGNAIMVLSNASSGLPDLEGNEKLEFVAIEDGKADPFQQLYKWSPAQRVVTGKVSLSDYDFERPKAKLETATEIGQGTHRFNKLELYDYQGRFPSGGDGKNLTRVAAQSYAAQAETWEGETDLCHIRVGRMLNVLSHPKTDMNDKFLCIKARHIFMSTYSGGEFKADKSLLLESHGIDSTSGLNAKVEFTTIAKEQEFRPPQITPWPEVPGIQTAMVKGPSGDEIHTDEYGRVKIKFHWDREGKDDGTSSCYVRCMMPWTGKNWGMINIPRIGQEVVVQFEDGNPDRPIVVGMLYNADTKPPYPLPGEATKSGIKTNSSKGGGGFNELMFEDKKGKELVRFQAQNNYQQIVKNNAVISVGQEGKKDGDMDVTVENNLSETINKGDHTLNVAKGNKITSIAEDLTESIGGNETHSIGGNETRSIERNVTVEVAKGDYSRSIRNGRYSQSIGKGDHVTNLGKGSMATNVEKGDIDTNLQIGDFSINCNAGAVNINAMKKITLTCGDSKIELSPTGITMKSLNVNVKADVNASIKGTMTTIKADAILSLSGSLTKIN